MPGFIDSYTHFANMAVKAQQLDLSDTSSKNDALARVKGYASGKASSEWIVGSGCDENHWSDARDYIKKDELDAVAPNNPVVLQRVECHLSCANK